MLYADHGDAAFSCSKNRWSAWKCVVGIHEQQIDGALPGERTDTFDHYP